MTVNCESCAFSQNFGIKLSFLECRRNPPVIVEPGKVNNIAFPYVIRTTFCGEYKPKGWLEHEAKIREDDIALAKEFHGDSA